MKADTDSMVSTPRNTLDHCRTRRKKHRGMTAPQSAACFLSLAQAGLEGSQAPSFHSDGQTTAGLLTSSQILSHKHEGKGSCTFQPRA